MGTNTKILVGKIVAMQGIRGDVRVQTYTEKPTDFQKLDIQSAKFNPDDFRFIRVVPNTNVIIAHINGFPDRTSAEVLRGTELFVERDALPAIKSGEYYQADLIGFVVIQDGKKVGIVTGFALAPGKDGAPVPARIIECAVEEAPVTHIWQKGDKILISDKQHRPVYEATKDGASVNFRWSQKNTASLITDAAGYFAYYPTTIIFKLPAVQEYAKDGPSLVPMMAHFLNTYSETFNPKFLFKNVCGVIKLNLTTSQPDIAIQSIVFHSDQPLCGQYRVNQNLQLRFTEPQDLTLTCPEVPIGENPTAFYVSVPPQIYDSLTLTIHTSDGRIATWNLQPDSPLTVQRAEIATLEIVCNDFLN